MLIVHTINGATTRFVWIRADMDQRNAVQMLNAQLKIIKRHVRVRLEHKEIPLLHVLPDNVNITKIAETMKHVTD